MIELYIGGALTAGIAYLWLRVKYFKNQAKAEKLRADTAENIASHNAAIAMTERTRTEGKPERIEEAVKNAENNNFDDFYN